MNTAKLKAAALAATPGPWTHDGCGGVCADVGLNGCYFVAECEGDDWGSNSEFIALANPAAVLELIAALEAAEKRIAELESGINLETGGEA
ncbi:ead/Ea22-like family protein [Cronobacter dublinensis]